MTITRWERIRKLFETACELDREARRAYLADACAGEEGLREEVESLLASSEQTPMLLDAPAVEAFPELFEPAGPEALVGRRVGAYELVRPIASGGMGAVFLAARADDEYDKHVAVKLVKHRIVTEETLRRFRAERQTLATLDHPNIARLLDGGVTPDGVPFFVMELIDGSPIDHYCDDRALTTRQRLRLFRQVCAAVSYAHQNLVVHRDLKPSNILVTPDGTPKLLDFGIAKVLEPNGDPVGSTVTRAMTPEYASPEQVRREPVTTATDVYSLGVILFELLTGHRPYRLRTTLPHELERTICEDEPPRPSTAVRQEVTTAEGTTTPEAVSRTREGGPDRLCRALSGDLDEIVLKSLRKEPARRYASVDRLSDDIRRHLEGLPVTARRGSLRYRGGKFLRRHRRAVGAGALIVTSLLAGLAVALWQGRAAVQARHRTEDEARKVHHVNAFLTGMLGSIDTSAAPGPQGALRAMLDEAAASLAAGALADQPEVEASVRMTVGMTYLELGALDEAGPHLDEALAIRVRAPEGGEPRDVAETLNGLGLLARARGDHAAAERLYREALRHRRDALGEDSPEYAETLNNLGVLLKSAGRLDEAEAALDRALSVRRDVARRRAATPAALRAARRDVATTMTNLAAVLKTRGDLARAETLYGEALGLFRDVLGPEHYRVAVVLNNLALLLVRDGRHEEAETLYRESLEVRRAVFGDEHLAVATGLKNLGLLLATMGRFEEAEPLYREALDLGRRLPGSDLRLATTLEHLADLLAALGRHDEAEPLSREALEIRLARDPNATRVAGSRAVLGRILTERGDADGAWPLLRESLAAYESAGHDLGGIARARCDLGGCLLELGRYDEAQEQLLESFSLLQGGAVHHPALARRTLRRLINLYEAWGRPAAAAPYRELEGRL